MSLLDAKFADRPFIIGDRYTIADIALYAYAGHAEEAELDTAPFAHFSAWCSRIEAQPAFLATYHLYAIDPHSANELS